MMMVMVMMVVMFLMLVDTLWNKIKTDNNGDVACQMVQEQDNNVSQVTQNSGQKNDDQKQVIRRQINSNIKILVSHIMKKNQLTK